MAAKELRFNGDARDACCAASTSRQCGRVTLDPRAATSCSTSPSWRAASPGWRDGRQGDRALRQVREHGRPDGEGGCQPDQRSGGRRHHHRDGAGAGDRARGRQAVAAGMNPMDLRRGIDMAVASVVTTQEGIKSISTNAEIARSARSRPMTIANRRDDRASDAEGRQ